MQALSQEVKGSALHLHKTKSLVHSLSPGRGYQPRCLTFTAIDFNKRHIMVSNVLSGLHYGLSASLAPIVLYYFVSEEPYLPSKRFYLNPINLSNPPSSSQPCSAEHSPGHPHPAPSCQDSAATCPAGAAVLGKCSWLLPSSKPSLQLTQSLAFMLKLMARGQLMLCWEIWTWAETCPTHLLKVNVIGVAGCVGIPLSDPEGDTCIQPTPSSLPMLCTQAKTS